LVVLYRRRGLSGVEEEEEVIEAPHTPCLSTQYRERSVANKEVIMGGGDWGARRGVPHVAL
jgi:hypothetical protein